jgi:tripartite ATP-independent transporter DctP family solute receptor
MKKTMLVMISLMLVMGFASLSIGADKIIIKIQHNTSAKHPWQQGFTFMKKELDAKYPGVFDITIYPNGSLAGRDWKVILEQTQTNVVQMMCESSIPFATLQKELFALNTPFLFDDMEHYLRFMNTRPEVVFDWFKKLESKDVQVLAVWPRPFRQLLNSKREIVKPEDIKGLKFRVPGLDLFVKTFEAMGAKPVPMSSGEIYTAMQLGTVVGEDNSIGTVYDFKTYEQGKYMNVWNYMADGVLVVVNKPWYESLSAEHQAAVKDIAMKAADVVYGAESELQKVATQKMTEAGIKFTYFTPEMKKPWIDLMDPVYAMIKGIIGEEVWNDYVKAVDAAR